jgi:hypothetical protein
MRCTPTPPRRQPLPSSESILKTPEVTKILVGEKLTTESAWAAQPWHIPAVYMYGRLAYKFEGMPDMINGTFMEDLSELLNSPTGDQRRRKTFYEIDTEFEKMTSSSLLKNFDSIGSLMPFLRASLRQTMIHKLAIVGKDKDGWKKADEHPTTLMDQEHIITLEDTDAVVISRAFFLFLLHKHFINKNKILSPAM